MDIKYAHCLDIYDYAMILHLQGMPGMGGGGGAGALDFLRNNPQVGEFALALNDIEMLFFFPLIFFGSVAMNHSQMFALCDMTVSSFEDNGSSKSSDSTGISISAR